MKVQTFAAALALASLPGAASAAGGQCLTRPEAQALVSFVLPDVVGAVAGRCTPLSGPGSYFARTPGLGARFVPLAQQSGTLARAAMAKSLGLPPAVTSMKDDDLRGLIGGMVSAQMTSMTGKQCGQIDEIMATLDPLPPANVSRMIVLLLDYIGPDKKGGMFSICKT